MTVTATKVSTLQMTVNVPVDIDLKYIDVWPNDPSKDTKNGKGFGASVAFKGRVNGEEVRVYPKGFLNKTIEKLVAFGVVEDGHYEHDPAEKYSIPVKNGDITIVNSQPAGARYANFEILRVGKESIKPNGAIPPTATPPKSAPAKQPISYSNVADADLPPLLRGAEAEDNAELAAKLGGADVLANLRTKLAVYQALTEYVVRDIAPIYEEAKIGMSPESSAACVQTLYINAFGK